MEVIHANGTTASLTEGFKYEAPLIQKVEVSAEPKTLVANGVATSQITIKLVDQNDELVPSETVSLSADQGTIPKVATNNQDGSYSAIYTASKQVGEVVITALTETHGKSGQVTLSLTERQLSTANSTLTVTEEFVVIKGDDTAHLTVKLVDQQDLALEKQLISVKVEPSEGVTISELQSTDAKGQSKFELQSDQAGEKTVTVTVGDQALAQTATVKFTSNLVTKGVISAASARVVVGKLTTVTVTLQNQESLPVSAQAVEISVEPADQATITQPTELTNLQGQTTAQLLVKQAGLKTIQAKSGSLELAATATILFEAGPLDKIELLAKPTRVKPEAAATITINLYDQYLNPIKSAEISLATTLGQIGAASSNGDGSYSAVFEAPKTLGKAILTATAGGKSNSMELEVSDKAVIDITPVITELAKGDSVQFEASENVTWAVKGDIGEIDNKGIFTATTEGEGKIIAILLEDPTVTSTSTTLKITPPKRIKTALSLTLPDKTRYLQPLTLNGELLLTQQTELKPTNLEVAIRLTSPTDEVREYQANTDQEGRYQVKAPIQLDEVGSCPTQLYW